MSIFTSAHTNCQKAKEVYRSTIFGALIAFEGPIALALRTNAAIKTGAEIFDAFNTHTIPEFIGTQIANRTTSHITKPIIRNNFVKTFGIEQWKSPRKAKQELRKMNANNLDTGRQLDLTKIKPQVARMVIILHDADKAGHHVDIHIGSLSIVKKLPKGFSVSRNEKGELTDATKQRVMELVANEFKHKAHLAQNLDHSYDDAKFQWKSHNRGPVGYGAGNYRLLVNDSPVYMYGGEHALHISAPHLVNNKLLYIYNLGTKEKNKVPILSLGIKDHAQISIPDKLHLRLSTRKEEFIKEIGTTGSVSIKYDGGSTFIHINKKGTTLWSPRISKKNGKRIEYNAKVIGIDKTEKSDIPILAQGELLYKDSKGNYLKAHEIGGILNGSTLPTKYTPEIRIYRICSINNKPFETTDINIHNNAIKSVVKLNPVLFKVPEKVNINELSKYKNVEGFVGIPINTSITNAIKLKERGDTYDWTVESINFKQGNSGRIAGVIWFQSESGKKFKMGASSFGSDKEVKEIWNNKEEYIGRVAKVSCFNGHEGRAATFVDWHMDK